MANQTHTLATILEKTIETSSPLPTPYGGDGIEVITDES